MLRKFQRSRSLCIRILALFLLITCLEVIYGPGFYVVDTVYTALCGTECRPDSCDGCFGHTFSYLIKNDSICRKINSRNIDLLIVITTVHGDVERRNVLRQTWLNVSESNTGNVRYIFLLGQTHDETLMKSVLNESRIYGDILMEDFLDSYHNLTHKTIMGMKWASQVCKDAKFFMKTDQDMFVNVPLLLYVLKHTRTGMELQNKVGGDCFYVAPGRKNSSKWYTSYEVYPHLRFPRYCSGTGYVTSMNVVKNIYGIFPNVPFFVWEDVYVALCLEYLGWGVMSIKGFTKAQLDLGPCEMRRRIITSHRLSSERLLEIANTTIQC